jgi:hypothetical protein
VIAGGIALVVVGLALFLEGLILGLMPLAQRVGIQLTSHGGLKIIIPIGFCIGAGATFAEPAVAALRAVGSTICAWDAPLLYFLLQQRPEWLISAIAIGVGIAAAIGLMRFYLGFSIKPIILGVMTLALPLTVLAAHSSNLAAVLGLAWDAEGLMRMLIEKGRLNRPGRGFIYCSPVAAGILDTSLLVGPQQHAATIEQVVAAIDRLEKSTAWRRRFPVLDPDSGFSLQSRSEKITLICQEEFAGKYADVAIAAGAGAATSARLQQISLGDAPGGACERCTFVVRSAQSKDILNALKSAQDDIGVTLESLDVEPVDFSFSYRAEASRFFRRGGAQSS